MKILNEMTLSRFFEKQVTTSFGIITAFRGEYTYSVNKELNIDLKNDLTSKGLIADIKLKGIYKENFRTNKEREVKEEAYLVFPKIGQEGEIGGLKKILMKLGEKYNQDSILYKSVYDESAYLIGTSRNPDAYPEYHEEVELGKFLPKYIGEFYSRMRGKPFVFSNINDKNIKSDSDYKKSELENLKNKSVYESLELEFMKSIDRRKEVYLATFQSLFENDYEIDIEETPNGYKHIMSPIEKQIKYNSKPMMQAYWIKNNSIIAVPKLHIDVVIEHPEKFGYTKEQLHEIFDKYNEPLGHEGKARQEIMHNLINNGWIRIRYTIRNDLWTIELNRLTNKTKDVIWSFMMLISGNDVGEQKAIDKMTSFSEVKITELSNMNQYITTMKEIKSFTGLFENAKMSDVKSILIENFEKENNFIKALKMLKS